MNLFAEAKGEASGLPNRLQWMNEPAEWQFEESDILSMSAPPLGDFFVHPAGTSTRLSAPFLYAELEGDFTVSTQVEVDMLDDFDSACLMVMIDNEHWAKVCFENSYRKPIIVSVVTQGTSDDCNGQALEVKQPYLRVTRSGDCYAFHYSHDGSFWYMARYFRMPSPNLVKVGVVTQSPVGQGCQALFRSLNYSPDAVKEIRSGE